MNLQRFSVATFNLYNLQLPGLRMNPGQRVWTDEEYARKIAWIAERLRTLDADVVGLEELWHREAMEQALALAGLTDEYELLGDPADGRRIICAALVRKGLRAGDAEWIDVFPPAVRLESATPMDRSRRRSRSRSATSPAPCCTCGSRRATTTRRSRCTWRT